MIDLKEKVEKIVRNAGNNLKNVQASYINEKSSVTDLVTDMDIKTQKYLIENLENLIENAEFFAEEKENQLLSNNYTWVIDPVDGTTNYAYNFKHSAISVALVKDKETILACCYNPYLDEMFTAIKFQGSFLNNKKISVNKNILEKSLVMVGTSPYDKSEADKNFDMLKKLYINARDLRRSGSAVLDLCYLACGRVDAFFEYKLSFWDYAAASLIIKEAGGIIENINGNFGDIVPNCVIAGNKNNISTIKELLKL